MTWDDDDDDDDDHDNDDDDDHGEADGEDGAHEASVDDRVDAFALPPFYLLLPVLVLVLKLAECDLSFDKSN